MWNILKHHKTRTWKLKLGSRLWLIMIRTVVIRIIINIINITMVYFQRFLFVGIRAIHQTKNCTTCIHFQCSSINDPYPIPPTHHHLPAIAPNCVPPKLHVNQASDFRRQFRQSVHVLRALQGVGGHVVGQAWQVDCSLGRVPWFGVVGFEISPLSIIRSVGLTAWNVYNQNTQKKTVSPFQKWSISYMASYGKLVPQRKMRFLLSQWVPSENPHPNARSWQDQSRGSILHPERKTDDETTVLPPVGAKMGIPQWFVTSTSHGKLVNHTVSTSGSFNFFTTSIQKTCWTDLEPQNFWTQRPKAYCQYLTNL